MSPSTIDRFGVGTRVLGLVAVAALGWAIVAPGGLFWNAALAAGLVGSVVATVLLKRSRARPTLAEVIATAEEERVPIGPRPAPARTP